MTRKYSIDLLRIISSVAVIIIHVVTAPVGNAVGEVSPEGKELLHLVHTLMLWAVPNFFMITGYCLLQKRECTYEYCFRHVLKYVGVLFTVGLFYALLEEVFAAGVFHASVLGNSVRRVISGKLWDHMWFVYSIIGVYLVLPVLHSFMQQGEKNRYILTGLLFLFTILFPALGEWISVGVDFPFRGYLFYVCFGGLAAMGKDIPKKRVFSICGIVGVSSVLYMITRRNMQVVFGYKSLPVCLLAVSIFLIVSNLEVKSKTLLLEVSACTWGMYLVHPFFINLVIKVLKLDLLTSLPYVKLPVFLLVILFVSYITVSILRRIPWVKKLF